jgi:hypothetical protein
MTSKKHAVFRALRGAALAVLLVPAFALAQEGTTVTGVSNAFNPALSANALFLGSWRDPGTDADGLKVQEVELALSSVVDPYLKADVYVAFEPAPDGPDVEVVALEEAFVRTTALPAGLEVKGGRFLIPFGRHNQLHAHAFPFVEAPLALRSILGEESASDVGVEAAYAPLVPWFLNLRVFAGDGAVEDVFDGESRDLAAGARVENLWDLSDATTLEGAVSVWDGPAAAGRRTLVDADVRVKYRDPRKAHGHVLEWTTELLLDPYGEGDPAGAYSLLRYRVARTWWLGAGYSLVSRIPEGGGDRGRDHEVRGQVAFAPSEFSALRAELVWMDPADGDRELAVEAQLNVTLGSHPAHAD